MKVYRYLSQPELDAILSNDTSSIGKDYERNDDYKRINSHRYKQGIKYLHFFKNKDDCRRIKSLHEGKPVEFYFAEFDIPFTVLIPHIGYGRYDARGYRVDIETVTEFAIPVSKFKPKYLTGYEIDQSHHAALEEVKDLLELIKQDIFKNSTLPELQKKPKQKPDSGSQDGPEPSL